MSRLNGGRYQAHRRSYPEESVTPAEHHALKAELVALLVLLFVAGVCMFGEPLMDAFMAMLGVK